MLEIHDVCIVLLSHFALPQNSSTPKMDGFPAETIAFDLIQDTHHFQTLPFIDDPI